MTKDNGLVGGSNELWIISTSSNYNKYCSTSCGQIITFSRHKTSDLRGKPYSTLDHFHLLHRKNIIQWFSFLHNQILLQKLLLPFPRILRKHESDAIYQDKFFLQSLTLSFFIQTCLVHVTRAGAGSRCGKHLRCRILSTYCPFNGQLQIGMGFSEAILF